MSRSTKGRILCCLALILDIGAPLYVTTQYFPIWIERSAKATISGSFVLLSVICAIPLFRFVKQHLHSPSAPIMWFVFFILFTALESVVSEVKTIALVGFVANLFGMVIYKFGKHLIKTGEKKNE